MIGIFTLCFAGTLTNYVVGSECNYTALAQCWDPLTGLVDPHQLLFPVYTDSALVQLCSSYKQALICNRPLEQNCQNQYLTEGTELAASYLCGDGYETYRESRSCFTDYQVLSSASRCNDSYMKAMSSLPHKKGSFQEKTKLICRFMNDIVSCVSQAARNICSDEAAEWIATLKDTLMQPAHRKIGCHERLAPVKPESKSSIVLGISIGAGLGFLTLMLVVLLLCRKQMKAYTKTSKWLSAKSRNTSLGPGRPYSNGPQSVSSTNGGASTAPLLDISPNKSVMDTKIDYLQLKDKDPRCSIQMEQSAAATQRSG